MKNSMTSRLALRTTILLVLTIAAFGVMQPITAATGYPEALKGLSAAAILAWAEMTILWIRLAVSPRVDEQRAVEEVHGKSNPTAIAIVHATNTFRWAVRLAAFIALFVVQGV